MIKDLLSEVNFILKFNFIRRTQDKEKPNLRELIVFISENRNYLKKYLDDENIKSIPVEASINTYKINS